MAMQPTESVHTALGGVSPPTVITTHRGWSTQLNTMIEYWLVTAEESDHVHKRMCATHEKACQQAWRWEDDCLDNIRMEFVSYFADQDDIPF
jgi:hypothetical protein